MNRPNPLQLTDQHAIAAVFAEVAEMAKAQADGKPVDPKVATDRIFAAAGVSGADRLDAAIRSIPTIYRAETVLFTAAKYPAWAGVAAALMRAVIFDDVNDPAMPALSPLGRPVTGDNAAAGMDRAVESLIVRSGIPAGPEGFVALDGLDAGVVLGVLTVWLEDYSPENADYDRIVALRNRLMLAVIPTTPAP